MQKNRRVTEVSLHELLAYGAGGVIPIALFNIAGQLMSLMGNISLGLSAIWLGVILIIPRIWDAVSDPLVGHFSDNIRTPWGRRRPFLLIGGIAVAISFTLMWWIPDSNDIQAWIGVEWSSQWFQLFYILLWLLIFYTACTVFEIPHGALGMEMTYDPHERTLLFSAKSFCGNLFAMGTPWLFALANLELFRGVGGNELDGMRYVSMIVALLLVPASLWWTAVVREPRFAMAAKQRTDTFWRDMKQVIMNRTFMVLVCVVFTLAIGFNFVNLLGYYISIFYLYGGDRAAASTFLGVTGTIWAITSLLAIFPLNYIAPRFGKRNTLLVAIGLMATAQLLKIVCYNPSVPYLIIIPIVLLSSGMLFFFTLAASMIGDVCDEDDLSTGVRSEGSYYSVYWWFIKLGMAPASLVAGLLIGFTQFDQTQGTIVDEYRGTIRRAEFAMEQFVLACENFPDLFPDQCPANRSDVSSVEVRSSPQFERLLDSSMSSYENLLAQLDSFDESQDDLAIDAASTDAAYTLSDHIRVVEEHLARVEQLQATLTADLQASDVGEELAGPGDVLYVLVFPEIELALLVARKLLIHVQAVADSSGSEEQHAHVLLDQIAHLYEMTLNLSQSLVERTSATEHLQAELQALETLARPVMRQSPRTLLMMRVAEIGLPLILCLGSAMLALVYPLTDTRCYQIKDALMKRNERRTQGAHP